MDLTSLACGSFSLVQIQFENSRIIADIALGEELFSDKNFSAKIINSESVTASRIFAPAMTTDSYPFDGVASAEELFELFSLTVIARKQ